MKHPEFSLSRPTAIIRSIILTGLFSVLAPQAVAHCPDSDPCETGNVYRIQSWPSMMNDAQGRSLLSLSEANALDEPEFVGAMKSMGGSTSLAIRFTVTRIVTAPNNYCECNLEFQNKGCSSNLSLETLRQCTRVCRRDALACTATGFNVRPSGGRWYSFPASTEWSDTGVWKKNAFEVDVRNRDWSENANDRIIKRARCIADELGKTPTPTLQALFENPAPCPSVATEELQREARN